MVPSLAKAGFSNGILAEPLTTHPSDVSCQTRGVNVRFKSGQEQRNNPCTPAMRFWRLIVAAKTPN